MSSSTGTSGACMGFKHALEIFQNQLLNIIRSRLPDQSITQSCIERKLVVALDEPFKNKCV